MTATRSVAATRLPVRISAGHVGIASARVAEIRHDMDNIAAVRPGPDGASSTQGLAKEGYGSRIQALNCRIEPSTGSLSPTIFAAARWPARMTGGRGVSGDGIVMLLLVSSLHPSACHVPAAPSFHRDNRTPWRTEA